jgi:YggT family protein
MTGPINTALLYLLNVIFGVYIIIVIVRLFLQTLNAAYHNPISQVVIKLTQPLVRPLQRVIPGYKGVDYSVVFLLLVLEILKVIALVALRLHTFPDVGGLVLWAIASGLSDIANVLFYAIIIGAVLSWFASAQQSPFAEVVYVIIGPTLRVFQRFIPSFGGLDFSPVVALIVVRLATILILGPLLDFSVGLALA